jgi:hypothetical protein
VESVPNDIRQVPDVQDDRRANGLTKGYSMNRNDMKRLQQAGKDAAETADKGGLSVIIEHLKGIESQLKTIATLPQLGANSSATHPQLGDNSWSSAWFRMFSAVVGGQVGWLSSALTDPERFEKRLKTLSDISTAAVNLAIKERKITVKKPAK